MSHDERVLDARTRLTGALTSAARAVDDLVGHPPTSNAIRALVAGDPDVPTMRAEIRSIISFLSIEARGRSGDVVGELHAALDETRLPLTCPDCGCTNFSIAPDPDHEAPAIVCATRFCGAEFTPAGDVLNQVVTS